MGTLSTYQYRKSQLDLLDLFSEERIRGTITIRDGIGGNTKDLSVDVSKMLAIYDILTSHQADAVQELGEDMKDTLHNNNGSTALRGISLDASEAYQYAITVKNGRGGVSKALNISHDDVKRVDLTIRQKNKVGIGLSIEKVLEKTVTNTNNVFLQQEKSLKDAERHVCALLVAQPFLLDGKPISNTLAISYGTGDKSLQVAKLRKLSKALSTLANEYDAHTHPRNY